MPAALDRYYTREEVLAFPEDGNRYELVHGELLVSPAPRSAHQRVVLRMARLLAPWVEQHGIGEVLISPADISFGGLPDVLVQPDLFVVATPDAGALEWEAMRHLPLIIEVSSPSTSRYDRFTTRRLYQEMRVPLYWLLDIERQRAEVWTPEATSPVIEERALTWHPPGATGPCTVELTALLDG